MDWFVNDGEDQISDCPCDRKIMHWTQFGAQVDPRLGFAAFLPCLLAGTALNFPRSLVRLAWILQHAATLLPMAGDIQAVLNSQTAGVSDIHAWG